MQNPARAAGLGRPTPADRTPEPQRIALVRRTLLESLSEPDSLIVLHAGCFDDPRGLVDTWLKTGLGPTPGAAEQSYLSPNTVKTQIKSLYRKLGVNSRAAAVTTAHSWNLV